MAFEMPATFSMLDFGGRSKIESHFLNRLLAHGVMTGSSLVNAPKSEHGFAFQSPPEHEIIMVKKNSSLLLNLKPLSLTIVVKSAFLQCLKQRNLPLLVLHHQLFVPQTREFSTDVGLASTGDESVLLCLQHSLRL
jgi:hypothetical protein